MPPVVVQLAAPPAAMASQPHHVNVVMANISKQPALPVADPPPFHSFLVKTALSIAVIASRLSVPLVATAATTHAATAEAPTVVAEIATAAVIVVTATTITSLAGKNI